MKILVIGLGSMGRRRIRLMSSLDENIQIRGVDLSKDRQEQAMKECNIISYSSLKEAIMDFRPDSAFVCTSPITHGDIVLECLSNNLNVFTEINLLSNWYEEALKLAKDKNLKLFISSTPMYRKEIQFIASKIKNEEVNYIYHVGQYLPDWHPWESYKNFFVANPKTSGIREIFAIEMPWLIRTFGEIECFNVNSSKMSNLDIDYCDNYVLNLKHMNNNKGVICFDIVSRYPQRNLEIYNENLHIFWDGKPDGLKQYSIEEKCLKNISLYDTIIQNKNYTGSIIENAYTDEILDFISMLKNNSKPKYTFVEDYNVLKLIDKFEVENAE